MNKPIQVPSLKLQNLPTIYVAIIPGQWLLKHCVPDWRVEDPDKGFQRIVKQERAEQIAAAVLDHKRSFPNAVILATEKKGLKYETSCLTLDPTIKFLVVDGQHRLWSQKFSAYEAPYTCIIHCGLDKVNMARLFLEINDNQKRVPASLRWDLVRLVRPEDDHGAITAVELVYELTTNEESPLYRRVDLTGEVPEKTINQGSLAPELKYIVTKKGAFKNANFQIQVRILITYLAAVRSLDNSGWQNGDSPYYKARILRVLLRLLPELLEHIKLKELEKIEAKHFAKYLNKINKASMGQTELIAKQGSAGMKAIYDQIKTQIF